MIKATKNKENGFPKLMISSLNGGIVLMTSRNGDNGTGTMVVSKGEYPIGDYDTIWDMSVFSDFEGSVTLENDKEAK